LSRRSPMGGGGCVYLSVTVVAVPK
jgi:hypothetical protein